MPFVIPGDKACPLKAYLMKPFARKNLSCEERVFNCRLSRARRCVDFAFVFLITKWLLLKQSSRNELQYSWKNSVVYLFNA